MSGQKMWQLFEDNCYRYINRLLNSSLEDIINSPNAIEDCAVIDVLFPIELMEIDLDRKDFERPLRDVIGVVGIEPEGGFNSAVSDIRLDYKDGYHEWIEVKMRSAFCGSFVANFEEQKRFYYNPVTEAFDISYVSDDLIADESEEVPILCDDGELSPEEMKELMYESVLTPEALEDDLSFIYQQAKENFVKALNDSYNPDGWNMNKFMVNEPETVDMITQHYECKKHATLFLTKDRKPGSSYLSDTGWLAFSTARLYDYCTTYASFRHRPSGSEKVRDKKEARNVADAIMDDDYGLSDYDIIDESNHLRWCVETNEILSDPDPDSVRMELGGRRYKLLDRDDNVYQIRRLSKSATPNIIFHLKVREQSELPERSEELYHHLQNAYLDAFSRGHGGDVFEEDSYAANTKVTLLYRDDYDELKECYVVIAGTLDRNKMIDILNNRYEDNGEMYFIPYVVGMEIYVEDNAYSPWFILPDDAFEETDEPAGSCEAELFYESFMDASLNWEEWQ